MGNLKDIIVINTTNMGMSLSPTEVIIGAMISLAIIITFYVLRSIGLYTLAKKNKLKNPYLAIIPFVWIYIAGQLSKTKVFFGRKVKHFSLFAVIFMSSVSLITLIVNVVVYFPLVGFYLQGGQIFISLSTKGIPTGTVEYQFLTGVFTLDFINPYIELVWLDKVLSLMIIVSDIASLIGILIMVTLYSNLFRRFWPQHSFLGTLLSIFGIFAPVIFAVRKREPVNFEQYIKNRYYGMYGNPNMNNPNNYYDGNSKNYSENKDPFGYNEVHKKREDDNPFPEFDDDNRK